jgi:hypothetical protein
MAYLSIAITVLLKNLSNLSGFINTDVVFVSHVVGLIPVIINKEEGNN